MKSTLVSQQEKVLSQKGARTWPVVIPCSNPKLLPYDVALDPQIYFRGSTKLLRCRNWSSGHFSKFLAFDSGGRNSPIQFGNTHLRVGAYGVHILLYN